MATNKAPTGRTLELSAEVPGTPDEVWAAIATGPGISSWFVPATVDGAVGGEVALTFGAYGTETSTITASEPGRRFAYGPAGGEDGLAFEWLVAASDSDSCVVRLINSGFGDDPDDDGMYVGMTEGWGIFLQSLRLYLTHHRGSTARASVHSVMLPGPIDAAWQQLHAALGFAADAAVGHELRSTDGVPTLLGTVRHIMDRPAARATLLTLDGPAPGTGFLAAEGDGEMIAVSVYLHLHGDRPDVDDTWATWLAATFPSAG